MKMIRRFFAYVITVLAVLVLTYGYVYWGNLLGEQTPAGRMIAWLSASEQKDQRAVTDFSEPAEKSGDIDAAMLEPPETAVLNVDEPVADGDAASGKAMAELSSDNGSTEAQRLASSTTESHVDDLAGDSGLQQTLAIRRLLAQARQAFHYRDYPTSIASYQQLIAQTPDNFDAYGELGNVYYALGKEQEAAAAYYEAAAIFIRFGKRERAASLMGTLSLLDTGKARQLLDLLDTSR